MNPDVNNTAADIKKYFYDLKRQQLGKPYAPHERFRKPEFWTAAAELCMELKAAPLNFTKAAFEFNNVPGGPFPTQLAGNAARNWYRQFCGPHGLGKDGIEVTIAEIQVLRRGGLSQAVSQTRHSVFNYFLEEGHIDLNIMPAFLRMSIYPTSLQMRAIWGRRAYDELTGNPHLLEAVQQMGMNLSWMEAYQ